jgi:hypothetical protein
MSSRNLASSVHDLNQVVVGLVTILARRALCKIFALLSKEWVYCAG